LEIEKDRLNPETKLDAQEKRERLMKILARACGHTHLNQLSLDDLTTWKHDMARLAGVPYGGVGSV